jgi:hypothetical protein
MPNTLPASSVSFHSGSEDGLLRFHRAATRTSPGTISRSTSNRFAVISAPKTANPVTFPPGRPRLATRFACRGSPATAKTIGMVGEARWAAIVARVPLRNDQIHIHRDKISSEPRKAIISAFSPPVLNDEILAFDIAVLAEAYFECLEPIRTCR